MIISLECILMMISCSPRRISTKVRALCRAEGTCTGRRPSRGPSQRASWHLPGDPCGRRVHISSGSRRPAAVRLTTGACKFPVYLQGVVETLKACMRLLLTTHAVYVVHSGAFETHSCTLRTPGLCSGLSISLTASHGCAGKGSPAGSLWPPAARDEALGGQLLCAQERQL